MDFSKALKRIKEGKKVAREGWNGKRMFIFIVRDGMYEWNGYCSFEVHTGNQECYKSIEPFICMFTADRKYVPWLASQTDILAEDWEVVQ